MSDSLSLTEPTDSPITSGAVLKELIALRRHRGITMLRVKESAPIIQRIPATADEANHQGLEPDDLFVAAYNVVRCGIDQAIRRPDLAHILRRTLNFHGEDNFLDDRRVTLVAEFDLRSKLYERLEIEAYTQLAGVLVSISRSPCRDDATTVPDHLTLDLKLTFERADLQLLLTMLTVEKRQLVRESIAQAVLSLLPNGKEEICGLEPSTASYQEPLEAIRNLVLRAMRYPSPRRGALPPLVLLHYLFPESPTIPPQQRGSLSSRQVPATSFYRRKAKAIRNLARRMEKIEEERSWVEKKEAKQHEGLSQHERRSNTIKQAEGDDQDDEGFDPTLYGMAREYDNDGNYIYPEGFDPSTGEWLDGYEKQREQWDAEYQAARERWRAQTKLMGTTDASAPPPATDRPSGSLTADEMLAQLDKNLIDGTDSTDR